MRPRSPAVRLLIAAFAVAAFAVSGPARPAAEDLNKELRLAAMIGDTETVDALLNAGAEIDSASHFGKTALMMAVESDSLDTVALLLRRGADVNARTVAGCTALTFAAENGHVGLSAMLIEQGANVQERTRVGRDALMIASRYGIAQVVQQLLSIRCGPEGLRPRGALGADAGSELRTH
jgi:ankyrin repeat protein